MRYKIVLTCILIFFTIFTIQYLLATNGSFHFEHDVDYFNPLARSFIQGRLDIPNPIEVHDLSLFKGKWYPYWGPIPAILLIPWQLVLGRYVPANYLSIFFGSLNVVIVWLILRRINREFFPDKNCKLLNAVLVIFFALGTSHVYVATKSGVWYVSQIVSLTPILIAFWILLKRKLSLADYFLASTLISSSLLNRLSLILYFALIIFRIVENYFFDQSKKLVIKRLMVCLIPYLVFFLIFGLYNYMRFGSFLGNGVAYHNHGQSLKVVPYGLFSYKYILRNLELIFLEIPKLQTVNGQESISFNREGLSIFFVSPVYLFAFLSLKSLKQIKQRETRWIIYFWITTLLLLVPIVLIFSPGLYQFGIRYSLDFSIILIALTYIGLRGKVNLLLFSFLAMSVILNVASKYFL